MFLYFIKGIYFLQGNRLCHSTNKSYSGLSSEDRKVSNTIKNEFDSKLVYNYKISKN